VILAVIAAFLIAPMLFILHVSYPVALIFVIFICGLIPMVGHTIGAIIVTFVALFHSVPTAIAILAYYILYQQIENYVIQPRVQANTTNLSPLLVLVAVVIGVSFGGLLGGLVAIPVMGCLRVLALDQIEKHHLLPKSELKAAKGETK
jgi:predicted PurR-regulated permease PerM